MQILIFDTHQPLSTVTSTFQFTQRHPREGCLFTWEKNLWRRVLGANKKQVPLKSYFLEIRIDLVNQILKKKEKVKETRNISMLTRITDRKSPCVDIHVYQTIKNWGPGPCNPLRHADNRTYFSGLPLTENRREAQNVLLGEGRGKILTCSCWEKGNFIMISKFKYGQTWKIST